MFTHYISHGRHLASNHFITKALFISTALVISTTQFVAAVESIPTTPVDPLPQTIRTQLVHVTGGATITEVNVDRTHGDPRYVAQYLDPATKEIRTVTLGQMGNVIDSSAMQVGDGGTTVGSSAGETPDRVKPLMNDGPVPITPPQRPIAPVMPDTPALTNTNQKPLSGQQKEPSPIVPNQRPSIPNSSDIGIRPEDPSKR